MADELQQNEIEENKPNKKMQKENDQEKKVRKEIEKLQFYLEDVDKLIEGENFDEIKQVCKRTQEIQDKLSHMVSSFQEMKIELGNASQRSITQ